MSERYACRAARIPVSRYRYESQQEPGTAQRLRIREIAQVCIRYGYRKIWLLLNREGGKPGKKLVYPPIIGRKALTLRHSVKEALAAMHRRERFRPTAPNEMWSLDFVPGRLADGGRFRALTIMDVFTRESLAIEWERLKGKAAVTTLNAIRRKRRTAKFLCCDNGSQFTGQIMDLSAYHHQVQIDFSRPGDRQRTRGAV